MQNTKHFLLGLGVVLRSKNEVILKTKSILLPVIAFFLSIIFSLNAFRGPTRGSSRALARGATTFNRARTVYAKPNRERSLVTRPAAMHVDDYQKAEEAESDHEKG